MVLEHGLHLMMSNNDELVADAAIVGHNVRPRQARESSLLTSALVHYAGGLQPCLLLVQIAIAQVGCHQCFLEAADMLALQEWMVDPLQSSTRPARNYVPQKAHNLVRTRGQGSAAAVSKTGKRMDSEALSNNPVRVRVMLGIPFFMMLGLRSSLRLEPHCHMVRCIKVMAIAQHECTTVFPRKN